MWVLVAAAALLLFVAAAALLLAKLTAKARSSSKNPFESDARRPRKEYVIDQKERDAVIKQNYNAGKVPSDLDAIVVGSGPGGLVTAAIMAKAGKRVLVLEQHDQAGGTFHTFIDKGGMAIKKQIGLINHLRFSVKR